MTNKPKATGTRAETAVTRWLRANGFPGADRQPLRGNRDAGDIAVTAGLVAEVKSHASAATGQPGRAQLAEWIAQAEAERVAAGAEHCPLIVRRKGTTDVGRWWAYLQLADLADLMGAEVPPVHASSPVCMSVESLAALLRAAGYGDPLWQEVGA